MNWNFKMWGAVGVVIIVLTASGVYLSQQTTESESVSIISRVNNDGSGIFVRDTDSRAFVTVSGTDVTYITDDWRGTIFMTPGPSSIQHMILMDIVTKKMGLSFTQNGSTAPTDGVRWTQVAPGNMVYNLKDPNNADITGGIAWEPHYAVALSTGGCKSILKTSSYWDGHPCCVVAGNNTYLSNNSAVTVRFLAAYVESVKWMQTTLAKDPSDPERVELINQAINVGTPPAPGKDQMSVATAEAALANIYYTYELGTLNEQLADVVNTYQTLDVVKPYALSNAGYATPLDFTNHLIKGEYLSSAFTDSTHTTLKTPADLGVVGTGAVRIKVAYLAADVHQLALHVGIAKGFFKDYGIEVELIGPFGAGGAVMNALLAKQADIGFVGSPPVVSTSINALG